MKKEIYQTLFPYIDDSYRDFQSRILNSQLPLLGIRMKYLRTYAKKILKEDPTAFLNENPIEYAEDEFLYVLVVGQMKCDPSIRFTYIDQIIHLTDQWCTIDTLCSCLKKTLIPNKDLYNKALNYLDDPYPFAKRFGYVLLLQLFAKSNTLQILKDIHFKQVSSYYEQMAKAWLYCECCIYKPNETLQALSQLEDDTVFRYSISKINDSTRIDLKIKNRAKDLRSTKGTKR